MKRRQALQSMLAAPAAAAAAPQAAPKAENPAQAAGTAPQPAADGYQKLAVTAPDLMSDDVSGFFSGPQLQALTKLAAMIAPAYNGRPGAVEAKAPQFLDFLLSRSPEPRQRLYREGLDALNASARKVHGKDFGQLDDAQAKPLLAPLEQPWTYKQPASLSARFLRAAKEDVLLATINSREWSTAAAGRRGTGGSPYWHVVDC